METKAAENEFEADSNDNDDLYEQYRFKVDKGQDPFRVDKFLINRIVNISRSRIQTAAKAGQILVNEKPVKSNYRVKPHDVIQVMVSSLPEEISIEPEDIPLEIIYEDNDLLVINKQPGLVVHPGAGNKNGTLVNGLMYYYDNLPTSGDITRGGLVHRLDKDTTGLMVVAKTQIALTKLAKQFFDRTIKRRYMALAWGDFDEDEGTIEGNIGRHPRNRFKRAVFPDGDEGKVAITHYKVLERFGYVTLLECRLETGRTHQIRVHMEYLNHPLFHDVTYGGDRIVKGTVYTKYKQFVDNCFAIMPRQALHAYILGFVHPTSGEFMEFEQAAPSDFSDLLNKWRNYFKYISRA